MATKHLLTLAKAYCGHTGLTLSTVSTYAVNGGAFFKNLEGGASCTLKTYVRALDWFSTNWPADLEWPGDIERPKRRAA